MTGNKFLLDTSIVIEIFKGNQEVGEKINDSDKFYISSVVLGELTVGINSVTNKRKHLKQLHDFLKFCILLDVDSSTAEQYGVNTAYLNKKGKPIPTNDVWIASTAIQHNLVLITRDKHFNEIEGLKIKKW